MKLRYVALLALSLLTFRLTNAQSQNTTAKKPDLIIMISVDMLSGEIMDRYGAGLPGGLGKLENEGVFFENAFHDHAFTETGPGHSVLLSGRHPSSTGITENSWRDSATSKMVYCVQDPNALNIGEPSHTAGSSVTWFKGTTLGTWLKHQYPGSRVFAVSGKDRASILMAGPLTDGVYWFQEGFGFTTSTFYAKSLPSWLTALNKKLMDGMRDKSLVWNPIGPTGEITYPGKWMAGDVPVISKLPRLIQAPGFPDQAEGGFLLGETQDGSFWKRWRASPFFDDAIFDAAEAILRNEHLGSGKSPDLLAIGLSATNALEHAYGNSGPEMLDNIRRLDRRLGTFLEHARENGKTVAVVLSADHGGLDFAERLQDQGVPAKRLDVDAWTKDLQQRIRDEFHLDKDLLLRSFTTQLYIDNTVAQPLGDRKKLVARIEEIVRKMPEVAVVASREELAALPDKHFDDPRDESIEYRLKYSTVPGRSGDILFAFQPLVELGGPPKHDPAQHGTPYDYDRRVPIIFYGPWRAERRLDPASTTDIAPTLAKLLGIAPEEKLDGVVLKMGLK